MEDRRSGGLNNCRGGSAPLEFPNLGCARDTVQMRQSRDTGPRRCEGSREPRCTQGRMRIVCGLVATGHALFHSPHPSCPSARRNANSTENDSIGGHDLLHTVRSTIFLCGSHVVYPTPPFVIRIPAPNDPKRLRGRPGKYQHGYFPTCSCKVEASVRGCPHPRQTRVLTSAWLPQLGLQVCA
ncbi:hypothetical protein B0J12DRAFT_458380 [Macrophomina phaseolina]|uniref:Uncharacterized protein n=1 Tax=Macrophomina phaseolina TaxID=35725 RepID=A0ABQ8GG26_9PEZI|nr:hypothetical protein B0J12DRAFT_458380 [Macrophomina phaseolina]